MKLFDSHAHYYDERFEQEVDGGADAVLSSVFLGHVAKIVNVGTCNENSARCIEQAARYEGMYAAVGIHPSDCRFYTDVERELAILEQTLSDRASKKIVALGEIGLDYHYENTDRAKQAAFFEAQLEMAERLDLPVIIHDREAHGDCMDTVRRHRGVRGVFHSFSGSAEMAKELVKLGWYISFSGVVTFKNAAKVKEAAAAVPLDRLMIETDCPYLAPHPHRGEINHSGLIHLTCEALADIHSMKIEEMAEITYGNSCNFFGIND
ncbi:MAG: TatD family hydrolase [Clostridia bacterium]|nr:TatD family hydrolase [Clostridia bacterium]